MTVLPFLDIKATPLSLVESSHAFASQSLPPISDTNSSSHPEFSLHSTKPTSPLRASLRPSRARSPKIKIVARSDELLKQLPHAKTARAQAHNAIWKPLIREPADYDYLWEPVQREDMRHQYDFYVAPHRIIASRPDEPYKMTTMFESEDRHYHNYRRVKAMQQRQWNKEHMQYTTYPYAQREERDLYNKQLRSQLKEQIERKANADKNEQETKVRESQIAIENDRRDLEQTVEKRNEHARFLSKYTAGNKELMQNKWEYDQWNRVHQWHVDRAILADDPINWSKTMT